MFVIGNKQISFAHIVRVVWVEERVTAINPETSQPHDFYVFDVVTSDNQCERMLCEDEESRKEQWESLIDAMEAAGY